MPLVDSNLSLFLSLLSLVCQFAITALDLVILVHGCLIVMLLGVLRLDFADIIWYMVFEAYFVSWFHQRGYKGSQWGHLCAWWFITSLLVPLVTLFDFAFLPFGHST